MGTGPGWAPPSSNKVCQHMPRYDRLSILVALVLFGPVVSHIVDLPTRTISFVALGVPTTIYLSGRWFIGGLLVVITGAGVDSIVRSHPQARKEGWGWGHSLSFWGLPCALTLLSLVVFSAMRSLWGMIGAIAVFCICLGLEIRRVRRWRKALLK